MNSDHLLTPPPGGPAKANKKKNKQPAAQWTANPLTHSRWTRMLAYYATNQSMLDAPDLEPRLQFVRGLLTEMRRSDVHATPENVKVWWTNSSKNLQKISSRPDRDLDLNAELSYIIGGEKGPAPTIDGVFTVVLGKEQTAVVVQHVPGVKRPFLRQADLPSDAEIWVKENLDPTEVRPFPQPMPIGPELQFQYQDANASPKTEHLEEAEMEQPPRKKQTPAPVDENRDVEPPRSSSTREENPCDECRGRKHKK